MKTTIDGLLNRRVTLEQPAEGYRVAVDTVLLAAAVPAQTGDRVLDMGCGVGGAMLALACRVPGLAITGIEIDDMLLQLCKSNIARNEFASQCFAREGDACALPDELAGLFDHVLMNPPFHDEARHDVSDDVQKRRANSDKAGELALWILSAARALKPSGCLTLIHRADRKVEIIAALAKTFTPADIISILPKPGATPKRIIIRARKHDISGMLRHHEFVLHDDKGGYTKNADDMLRHVAALTT